MKNVKERISLALLVSIPTSRRIGIEVQLQTKLIDALWNPIVASSRWEVSEVVCRAIQQEPSAR